MAWACGACLVETLNSRNFVSRTHSILFGYLLRRARAGIASLQSAGCQLGLRMHVCAVRSWWLVALYPKSGWQGFSRAQAPQLRTPTISAARAIALPNAVYGKCLLHARIDVF
jgi:hypothetical protein